MNVILELQGVLKYEEKVDKVDRKNSDLSLVDSVIFMLDNGQEVSIPFKYVKNVETHTDIKK